MNITFKFNDVILYRYENNEKKIIKIDILPSFKLFYIWFSDTLHSVTNATSVIINGDTYLIHTELDYNIIHDRIKTELILANI